VQEIKKGDDLLFRGSGGSALGRRGKIQALLASVPSCLHQPPRGVEGDSGEAATGGEAARGWNPNPSSQLSLAFVGSGRKEERIKRGARWGRDRGRGNRRRLVTSRLTSTVRIGSRVGAESFLRKDGNGSTIYG
jgi:hypothetical protein